MSSPREDWVIFFFSSRRRHTRFKCDWSSDVCSSDLDRIERAAQAAGVLGLVLRVETRQHVAGTLVDEMDEAEIPAGVADLDAVEMPITVRHLETAALDDDCAVALLVGAMMAARDCEWQRSAVG